MDFLNVMFESDSMKTVSLINKIGDWLVVVDGELMDGIKECIECWWLTSAV